MLVLCRKIGEEIVIGDDIVLLVKGVAGPRVTLGIKAPGGVRILRGELTAFARKRGGGLHTLAAPPLDAEPAPPNPR